MDIEKEQAIIDLKLLRDKYCKTIPEYQKSINYVLNELEKKETLINTMQAEFERLEGIEDTVTMLKIENEEKIEAMRPYKDTSPFDFGVLQGIDEACRIILKKGK